jgi:hypothetical protein
VSAVVVITPVRGPRNYPEDIEDLDELPYDTEDKYMYEDQLKSMRKMCKSAYLLFSSAVVADFAYRPLNLKFRRFLSESSTTSHPVPKHQCPGTSDSDDA